MCRFDGKTGTFRDESPGISADNLCQGLSNSKTTAASRRKQRLQDYLSEVKNLVSEDLEMLERSSDVVIGMRIIQQFVLDLLGRNTSIATIFRNKTEAE